MNINPVLKKLDNVLIQLRERHPVRSRSGSISVDETILDYVREKLRQCSYEEISSLAAEFQRIHLVACFEILVSDREGDVAEKAAEAIKLRPREHFIEKGWFRLVSLYPHDLLELLLKHLIELKGFSVLERNEKISDRIKHWFLSSKLSMGALRDYEKNWTGNIDSFLVSQNISKEQGFYREVIRALFSYGSADSLKKEKAERIYEEFNWSDNVSYRQLFCSNYLNKLRSRENWSEFILEFIEDNFNVPNPVTKEEFLETPFWSKIDRSVKKEFLRWKMLERIEDFFDGERADYWRKYVENGQIIDVKNAVSANGFLLDFDKFGVVEFKNVGNAAYIYPRDVFKIYWSRSGDYYLPDSYKDKKKTVRSRSHRYWDGRIIHHRDWTHNTDEFITSLLRER